MQQLRFSKGLVTPLIQDCRVILSRYSRTLVFSLQSDPFRSRRVPLFGTYVSRRLLTPVAFPPQCYAFNIIRSISLSSRLLALPSGEGASIH